MKQKTRVIEKRSAAKTSKTIKAIALGEIFTFIISSFAFAFIIGGMIILESESASAYELYYNPKDDRFEVFSAKLADSTLTSSGYKFVSSTDSSINLADKLKDLDNYRAGMTTTSEAQYNALGISKTSTVGAGGMHVEFGHDIVMGSGYGNLVGDIKAKIPGLRETSGFKGGTKEASPAPSAASAPSKDAPPVAAAAAATSAEIKTLTTKIGDKDVTIATSDGKTGTDGDSNDYKVGEDGKWALVAAASTGKQKYTTPLGTQWETSSIIAGNLVEGLSWASWVLTFTQLIGGFLPGDQGKNVKAFGLALSAGIMAGKATYALMTKYKGLSETMSKQSWIPCKDAAGCASGTSFVIGAVVAFYMFANTYKKTKEKSLSIEFKCMPWQAPSGGADCNKCNGNPLQPCSEYRCRSLGQTCKLINAGTGSEKCIDSSPNDVTSPGIKPWPGVLTQGLSYSDIVERPPGNANTPGKMRVVYNGGCLPAFTPFEFGIITTDVGEVTQPAQCKIDFNHTKSFNEMQYWMGEDNLYSENHSQIMSLPGTDLLNKAFDVNNSLGIKNDGEYTMYIRCKDGNGNENRDEFAVRFCIDKTPDTTAPLIKAVNPLSGSAVLYQVDNVSTSVYTNEPANCRWSREDRDYSNMENNMSCSNNVWEMNAELLYTCTTTLTSVKDKEENQFYFRCADLLGNQMRESYSYKLIGTQPLDIIDVSPEAETVIGSSTSTATVELQVKTDNGFNKGEASCFYSPTTNENDYIAMFETGSSTSKQKLDLLEGNYNYYFKCVDAGGNTDYNLTSFTVFVDKYAPIPIRVYTLGGKIVVLTDEEASCYYSTTSCNFDISKNQGINMPYDQVKEHFAEWKLGQNYYIKCKDKYNNSPLPSECSFIARPFQLEED